jgi:hypothetical protein
VWKQFVFEDATTVLANICAHAFEIFVFFFFTGVVCRIFIEGTVSLQEVLQYGTKNQIVLEWNTDPSGREF